MVFLVTAYIMIKLEAGEDERVFAEIKNLNKIREANVTYGGYDLLIEVEFKSIEELDEFVFGILRRIPGVTETMTILVAKNLI